MNAEINGKNATFTVRYTDSCKIIHFTNGTGYGAALSWTDALKTIRTWAAESLPYESVDDAELACLALAYASKFGFKAKLDGFLWLILTRDGTRIAVYQASTFNSEEEALIGFSAPRLPIELLTSGDRR